MHHKKRVFIIHGYAANSSKHWFAWLKEELEKKAYEVDILDMPNSLNPELNSWLDTLRKHIGELNENMYIVAHSLGCISALRYIEGFSEQTRLGGVLLLSGFCESLSILPILDPFVKEALQAEKLQRIIQKALVLSAENDTIVPTILSQRLAQKINAKFIQVKQGGHFMEEEGVKKLPILLELFAKEFE